MKKTIFILICTFLCFSILTLTGCSSKTEDDDKEVQDLIISHFKAIESKDYSAAWDMFSSDMKKGYSKNDANQNHFGIESVKLISIETYTWPQKANEDKTPHFQVKLDIVPNQHGAWNNGMNERFVGVVKEQGDWKIRALATSP